MDQVASFLKRPETYYNIDGMGELGVGFMCLGYALIMWLQLHTRKDSIWNPMYLFVGVGLMCVIIHYGTRAIKNHITYPRTGFVVYRMRIWPRIILLGVSALVSAGSALLVFVTVRSYLDILTPVFLMGLLLAASYAYGIARRVPWKWAVVLGIVLGSLAIAIFPGNLASILAGASRFPAWFPAKSAGAFLLCMMLYGSMFLISGGISFWLYLRHTQAPGKEANEPANSDIH